MMEFEILENIATEAKTVRANTGLILTVKKLRMETTSKGNDFGGTTLGLGKTHVNLVTEDDRFYGAKLPSGSTAENIYIPASELQRVASYLTK